jgi:hypothetical protein
MTPESPALKPTPNFAAWSTENLANYAAEAYVYMQEQAWELEQERCNTKAALEMVRKLLVESDRDPRG